MSKKDEISKRMTELGEAFLQAMMTAAAIQVLTDEVVALYERLDEQ